MDYSSKLKVVKNGLSDADRLLTVATFAEFICESPDDIYLPHQTLTATEMQGLSFEEERSVRQASI